MPINIISTYHPPGVYSRFIPPITTISAASTTRSLALIGKAQEQLTMSYEPIKRGVIPDTTDLLSQSNVVKVLSVGDYIGGSNYIEHKSFVYVQLPPKSTAITLLDKIKVEKNFIPEAFKPETYILTVKEIGGPGIGKFTITPKSTGVPSPFYTTQNTFALHHIPGVLLYLPDTLNCEIGDEVEIVVTGLEQEGDFIVKNGTMDWSLNIAHPFYSAKISIPVKVTGNPVIQLLRPINKVSDFLDISPSILLPPEFVFDVLDDAIYTVQAISNTQYKIIKEKNGVIEEVKGILTSNATEITSIFNENTAYFVDGFVIKININTPNDVFKFKTKPEIIKKSALSEKGLYSKSIIFLNEISNPDSDLYKIRVYTSDIQGIGKYVATSLNSGITSSPQTTNKTPNNHLIPGIGLIIEDTIIELEKNINLILNSSFEGGPLLGPYNWLLGNNSVLDNVLLHDNKTLLLKANTQPLTAAVGRTFKFKKNESQKYFGLSLYLKGEDNSETGKGVVVEIAWYDESNNQIGSVITTEPISFTTNTTRATHSNITFLENPIIPINAIYGKISIYNTSSKNVYIDGIQLEIVDNIGDAVTNYKESDIFYIKTHNHRIPKEPLADIAAYNVLPSYCSNISKLIKFDVVKNTVRNEVNLLFIKTSNTTFDLINLSTGDKLKDLQINISYTNIPGIIYRVVNSLGVINYSDFENGTMFYIKITGGLNSSNEINSPQYYVSYIYKIPESVYYKPMLFTDRKTALEILGEPTPQNSLALAASIAFENGANTVYCIQLDDTNDFKKAIDILKDVDVTHIVPLVTLDTIPGGDNSFNPTKMQYNITEDIFNYIINHCEFKSSIMEKGERVAYLGHLRYRDPDLLIAKGKEYNNERIVLVAPSSAVITTVNQNNVREEIIDGCFLAVAAAAKSIGLHVAASLTRKSIAGFTRLNELFTQSQMNKLSENGILVIENINGVLKVRHSTTTNVTTAIKQEPSIIQIKDYVIKRLRLTLENFIGEIITPKLVTSINSTVHSYLLSLVADGVIDNFSNLKVSVASYDRRVVEVEFNITPMYPLNWILITYSFNV